MALNEHMRGLIRAVADNDLQKAKAFTKCIVASETAACNAGFCNAIKRKLETSSVNLIEMPASLKGVLTMEDVSVSFSEARYHLPDGERNVFGDIMALYDVGEKLSEMGIRYVNATMLYGESGTGKTTFGRFVAYKLGLPFAYVNFSHCIGSLLGDTSKNIARIFDHVATKRCVLMLDEIDAIGMKRGGDHEVGEMSRVVIGLMQAMDKVENGVVVIGATNRADIIDPALMRRFPITHEVLPLNCNETLIMIGRYLNDVGIEYDGFDLMQYAKGYAKPSQVMNDVNRAIVDMLRTGQCFRIGVDKEDA